MEKLAIIILNWNGEKDTIECINSIEKKERYNIFILDNGSKRESWELLKKELFLPDESIMSSKEFLKNDYKKDDNHIKLILSDENLGFAKGNNLIWRKVYQYYEYCLLLNNDTVLIEDSLKKMIKVMDKNKNIGVLSTDIRLFDNPNKRWNAGGKFTLYGDRKYYPDKYIDKLNTESYKTEFVTGCVMMVRKNISEGIGFFTEDFFFGEEDFNYCLRLKNKNVLVVTLLNTIILHKVGSSANKKDTNNNRYILHFTNRIINMKKFYSNRRWKIWRQLYIKTIFFHSLIKTKSYVKTSKRVQSIKFYTSELTEVTKKSFEEIMTLDL